MIGIFRRLLLATLLLAMPARAAAPSASITFHVVALSLEGLSRTDRAWLESYIDQPLPADLTLDDAKALERRLLTTAVFSEVHVTFVEMPRIAASRDYLLQVKVEERWTTIPVVRGVYGGGTPLRVAGGYDIHTFGRLITLGGEARKYGDAPPGYVLYFRNPRADADRYYLGAELWREFRRRDLWDDQGKIQGHADTDMSLFRARYVGGGRPWKYGADLELVQEAPSHFEPQYGVDAGPPTSLDFNPAKRRQLRVLPTLLYDDIEVENLSYDGLRSKLKAGPVLVSGESRTYSEAEVESYGYKLLPHSLNFAARAVVGATTFNSFQTNYFLGGLDTIRGIPDGAIYGTHAAYTNLELRQLSARMKYLWIQPAVFVDAGEAGLSWGDATNHERSTAGAGVRLAVPQVYRMILRVDYGWSLIGPRTQGLTAGLNQFFDPYIPL